MASSMGEASIVRVFNSLCFQRMLVYVFMDSLNIFWELLLNSINMIINFFYGFMMTFLVSQ